MQHRGPHAVRAHAGDVHPADAGRAQVGERADAEREHRVLARGVHRLAGRGDQAGERDDVDDVPASGLAHHGERGEGCGAEPPRGPGHRGPVDVGEVDGVPVAVQRRRHGEAQPAGRARHDGYPAIHRNTLMPAHDLGHALSTGAGDHRAASARDSAGRCANGSSLSRPPVAPSTANHPSRAISMFLGHHVLTVL